MDERPIGDVFEYPGYGWMEVKEEPAVMECFGCVFNGARACLNDGLRKHTGACSLEYRADGTGVIFVKHHQ